MTQDALLREALTAITGGITTFGDLLDHCLDHTDLAGMAEEEELFEDDYLMFVLDESARVLVTKDDQIVRLDELADGLIFTHRLTEEEVEADMVEMVPDLAGLDLGTRDLTNPEGPITLEFARSGYSENGSWVGPAGWISSFRPGDLLAFRRVGDSVVVESAGEVAEGAEETAALRRAFEELVGFDEEVGEEPWVLLQQIVATEPGLFRAPVRPIGELLADAGLVAEDGYLGPADAPWERPGVAAAREFRHELVQGYDLDVCCEAALDVAVDAFRSYLSGDHLNLRTVNRALNHGGVIGAFVEWLTRHAGLAYPLVGEFARALISPGRRHEGGASYLLARHLEAAGDPLGAEAALEEAVRSDPDFPPALAELARYASDRGDAERVVSLMRRAGIDEDNPLLEFHASLGTPVAEVGRNETCPCGSGRKYKQCHLGNTEISHQERLSWLLLKLTMYVNRPERSARLVGLASSAMWEDFEIEDLAGMRNDEFIVELAMFEGGGVSDFLYEREPLLPADERQILADWEHVRFQLWEVVETDSESTLTMRHTGSGDTQSVTDHSAAAQFRPGDQVLARLLPAWGQTWLSGIVVPVVPQHRDSLIRLLDGYPDADTLAMWYGSLHAPPRLSNREGESLVLSSVVLAPTGSWDELQDRLDETYEASDDEDGVWHEFLSLAEEERLIRAVLRRKDDQLELEVNSEERLERVLAALDGVAEVVSQTARPVATVADVQRMAPERDEQAQPGPELPPDVIDEIRQRMEERWLDEEVPALGGLTPREAAADPTRRDDLIRLLRSFDRRPIAGDLAMRPQLLREKLGIEE